MIRFFLSSLGLLLFAAAGHAGIVGSCPDATYPEIPIVGVTGGTATSCGWANVSLNESFVATPGNGTQPEFLLSSYLGLALSTLASGNSVVTEGSAIRFANFTLPGGGTLRFDWESDFGEGATGVLFYVLNGSLVELERINPLGQSLPGARNSGNVILNLGSGPQTLSFGALSIADTEKQISLADPRLNLIGFSVTSNDVPEPATLGMLGLAVGVFGLTARLRRRP
jgi:hypothetical protein